MSRTLYLASSNPGKLRELAPLSGAAGIAFESLSGYAQLPAASEDADSFAVNALDKALHYSHLSDGLILADDSGLAVEALGGGPGFRSARYAGPRVSDEDNNRALLEALADVPDEKRTARYVCVLVLARRGQALALFSDDCRGHILRAPRGAGGFGYDPLFFFPPLNRTMAELPVEEKNRYSHRGKAFSKLLAYLKEDWP